MSETYLFQDGILLALIEDNNLQVTQALVEISILRNGYLEVLLAGKQNG